VDEYTSSFLREAIIDVFTYCYLGTYSSHIRDIGITFDVRVLSHLITHTIALLLEMPGLATLVAETFQTAFVQYCASSADAEVEAALKQCFSRNFLSDCGLGDESATLLVIVAFAEFNKRVKAYKRDGRVLEVLKLMDAIPNATAEMYCQTTREEREEREADGPRRFDERDNNGDDQEYAEDEDEDGYDDDDGVNAQFEREAQQEDFAE
jgi:hypothetical protein